MRLVRPQDVSETYLVQVINDFEHTVISKSLPKHEDYESLYTGGSDIYRRRVEEFQGDIQHVVLKSVHQEPGGGLFTLGQYEAGWLTRLQHSDSPVIQLYGYHRSPVRLTMVLENCGKNMLDYTNDHNIDERQLLRMATECCSAVSYVHQKKLLVRDIKPENFLLANRGGQKRWILADLGMMSDTPPKDTHKCGSALYAAPDYLFTKGALASFSSEAWALGITLMVCAKVIRLENDFPLGINHFGEIYWCYGSLGGFHKACCKKTVGRWSEKLGDLISYTIPATHEKTNCFDPRVPAPPLAILKMRGHVTQVCIPMSMMLRAEPAARMSVTEAASLLEHCEEHASQTFGPPQPF